MPAGGRCLRREIFVKEVYQSYPSPEKMDPGPFANTKITGAFQEAMKNRLFKMFLLSAALLAVLTFNFSAPAAEPKKIALLPFKINAEKDMTFLQNGIFDMLTSRLSKEGEVVVIGRQAVEKAVQAVGSPATVNESLARKIGSRLNADYTLFGSLTVFGDSISIDAKMVDVTGATPTSSYFDQSKDLGGVITKINQIAAQINANIFGRQTTVAQKAAPSQQAAKPAQKDSTQAHPEKLLQNRGTDGEGSPFMMMDEEKESFHQFWRSASFKHVINGIAVGDVDRDGKIETVVATPHSIIIYRSEGGKFYKAQEEIKEGQGRVHVGVDVADINENGYAEIFVSSLNKTRNRLISYVLEYDGKNFSKIVDNSPYYYRVADIPARGKILLGQRHNKNNPFSSQIYDMIWQNSDYVPENEIRTHRKTNLLGFTLGDVLNNHQELGVSYRENDHILIVDASGKEIWRSGERYGGSTLYSAGDKEDRGGYILYPQYYPMRLLVADTNGDGTNEVIAVKNHELARMKLEKFRKFTNAHIVSLSWDGIGLATQWKTRKISGFIRDYAVGDFDNDGKMELIAAVVQSEGQVVLVGEPKSLILTYELPS